MHEFTNNDPQNNDGVPEGRFSFEQVSALLHMRYFYFHDPNMPGLAEQALTLAREDMRSLESEVSQNEEAEAEREVANTQLQLEHFFEDFRDDFIAARKQWPNVQIGVANHDDDPANLNHYGAHFTESEQYAIRAIRLAIRENPTADEGDIVREGRVTTGEMLLAIDAERQEHNERMRRILGGDGEFLLRHVLDDGPSER